MYSKEIKGKGDNFICVTFVVAFWPADHLYLTTNKFALSGFSLIYIHIFGTTTYNLDYCMN